jgi:O-methyltransferase involved in polyketide biosynthesis
MLTNNLRLPTVDATVAHPARRYNYWLGGKDNFAADRTSGDAIAAIFPSIRTAAAENRRFLQRTVRYLVQQAGVRQFLDIGAGLPTADNTHAVAQSLDSSCRVVYVDNDPMVLAHAQALLTSHPDGAIACLHADLREPHTILADDPLKATLDLSQPIAVLLAAVLHFVPDAEAYTAVRTIMHTMPPGSYLVISHATTDLMSTTTAEALTAGDYPGGGDFTFRNRSDIAAFCDGLNLVPPGLRVVSDWRPGSATTPPPQEVSMYGAVARKPSMPDKTR